MSASTSIRSQSCNNFVAISVPIIQGFFSSLAVIAACESIPHASVINALHLCTKGKYSGLVIHVTKIDHSSNSSIAVVLASITNLTFHVILPLNAICHEKVSVLTLISFFSIFHLPEIEV